MEYIREALERQQALLRLLMMGQSADMEREQAGEVPRSRPVHQAEMAGRTREAEPAPDGVPAGAASPERGREALRRPAAWETLRGARARRSTERLVWARWADSAGTEDSAAPSAGRRSGGAPASQSLPGAAAPEEEKAEYLEVREIRRSSGAAKTEAKALSRAFQRDARRYDGSFQMY